jgi:hypothetical protein
VGELGDTGKPKLVERAANEILDSFHVVPGHSFELGQRIDLGLAEVAGKSSKC